MADVSDEQQQAVDNSNGSKPKLVNCRGTHAQFLRENPRFLNDPICHVVPSETSRDVDECLSWGVATTRVKPPTRYSTETTTRTVFQPPLSQKVERPPPQAVAKGILPVVFEDLRKHT